MAGPRDQSRKKKGKRPDAASSERAASGGEASFQDKVLEWVETLAVAVLYALFIKFFVVEAFRIPTSSMEPTLIGNEGAGLSDKILVAKNHYLLFDDPARWDVSVFKYPHNRARAYVKRIVGLPGDWLMVQDGDLFDCPPDQPRQVLERTRRQRDSQYYRLFPQQDDLGQILGRRQTPLPIRKAWGRRPGVPSSAVTYSDTGVSLGSAGCGPENALRFLPSITNVVLSSTGEVPPPGRRVPVEDVLVGFDLELPGRPPGAARVTVRTERVKATGEVDAEAGVARLRVVDPEHGDEPLTEPVEVPLPPAAGSVLVQGAGSVRMELEHVDFTLRLWLDGTEVATLSYGPRRKATTGEVQVELGATAPARFEHLELWRDIYYTSVAKRLPSGELVPGSFVNHAVLVPPGHYVLMGDNSPNSADARHWHLLGYLRPGRVPRVYEHASYARIENARGVQALFDIYGRRFSPEEAEEALLNPMPDPATGEKKPYALGRWLVRGEPRLGFVVRREEAPHEPYQFVDYEGRSEAVEPTEVLDLHRYAFFPPESSLVTEGEEVTEAWSAPLRDAFQEGGRIQYVDEQGQLGTLPPGWRMKRVDGVVFQPFVPEDYLMGKAFSIFWPAGLNIRQLPLASKRFRYIR